MEGPILSPLDVVEFTAPSGRTYTLAPLTYRQKVAMEAELTREAGIYPGQGLMLATLREVVRGLSPANAEALVAAVDAAEAAPDDVAAQAAMQRIEVECSTVPAYAALLEARSRRMALLPWVAARHALRAVDGVPVAQPVAPEAVDALGEDVGPVGWRAWMLAQPSKVAEGNSAAPSRSSGSRGLAKGESARKAAGGGASRARNGSATRG